MFPLPWSFTWKEAPRILDAEGKVVVVLPTGTIQGPYNASDVRVLANRIIEGVQAAEQKRTEPTLVILGEERCDCGKPFPDNGCCDFCGTHARYVKVVPAKPLLLRTRRPSKPQKRKK